MSWTQRRIGPRVPVRLEAAYEDRNRQIFLHSRDVSEDGIFLFAPDPPAVGDWVKLVLDLPGHGEILRLSGRVLRREAEPGAEPGFVVHFDHGDDGDRGMDPDADLDDRDESACAARKALRSFVNGTFFSAGESRSS
jgi:hypothetical protein